MPKPRPRRGSRKRQLPKYVIVPKHQMRAKTPAMLVDPDKVVVTTLTQDLEKAATFTTRSGAFRRVNAHKELRGKFWYRRVA